MAAIILAFITGLAAGVTIMRAQYGSRLGELVREFEGLKLKWAVLKAQYDTLHNIVFGSKEEE